MKREMLKEMGLTEEQIEKVMAANGEDITREQGKAAKIKTDFETVTADFEKYKSETAEREEKYKGFDELNKELEGLRAYKTKAESKERFTAVLGDRKPVNGLTRDGLFNQFSEELGKDENKGKTDEDIFSGLVKDHEKEYFGGGVGVVSMPSSSAGANPEPPKGLSKFIKIEKV